jgi:hypothetical protein
LDNLEEANEQRQNLAGSYYTQKSEALKWTRALAEESLACEASKSAIQRRFFHKGLDNYWPVKMADVMLSVETTSQHPTFTAYRFGKANDAILVTNSSNRWSLQGGVYLHNDYTITAWVKNLVCSRINRVGWCLSIHLIPS